MSLRALLFLVGSYYFLQGIGGNPGLFSQSLSRYLTDDLGLNAGQQAEFFFLITIPWMLKPIYGVISDGFPILGYKAKSYFILSSLLALGAYGYLSWQTLPYSQMVWCFAISAIGIAFSDVLCDKVMVINGQKLGATDRLQSAQWSAAGIAGIFVAFLGGYAAEYLSLQSAIAITMAAPLLVIAITVLFLEESKSSPVTESLEEMKNSFRVALKTKTIWAASAFIFLLSGRPNLGSAFYIYETKVLGFDQVLIGYIGTIGSIGFILGTICFGWIAKFFSHKRLLQAVVIINIVSTLAYLFFEGPVSAYIVTFTTSAVGAVSFLGVLTLAAKVCPKNAEGTVFALLMSLSNLGAQIGGIAGGKLYDIAGFSWLVAVSALCAAAMWFFLPLVQEEKSM